MEIFDGHNDTVQRIKEYSLEGIDFLERTAGGHLDLPRAQEGGLTGGLFAMFVRSQTAPNDGLTATATGPSVRWPEPVPTEHAKRSIAQQLAALKALEARACGKVRITTSVPQIEQARRDHSFAIVIHMEGAEAIGHELHELYELYEAGLRSLGLVWSRPNLFGHGVSFGYPGSPDIGPGLTEAGKDLVKACNRLGIMIDLSHLNERGFWDVAQLSNAPLVATHACAHSICPSTRNLTDRQLDAIRDSDGIVGVNFCVNDIRPDGRRDAETPLDLVARHFVYLADRLGIDRVAIGSDFDGTRIPADIGDASGLPRLLDALRAAHFDEASLRKIASENWMRVLRLSLQS